MLPFLIHKVLLQLRTWEESEAKHNQAISSPDPCWTTEKNLILFCELVMSFIGMAPNTKSGAIPQRPLGAQAFPRPLERGTLHGCCQQRVQRERAGAGAPGEHRSRGLRSPG